MPSLTCTCAAPEHTPTCLYRRSAAAIERRAVMPREEVAPRPEHAAPGGWAVLPSWIVCDRSLTPEARMLLLILSAHADRTNDPFPSIGRMAHFLGRSERQVLRLLAELEGRHLIQRRHRYREGEQVSSAYRLRFDRWAREDDMTPVSGGGDTGVTPRGDTGVTPRGDTGVARTRTTEQDQGLKIPIPPTPHVDVGGSSRGDRIRQLAREEGIRLRDARRIVERQEHIAANPPPPDEDDADAELEVEPAFTVETIRPVMPAPPEDSDPLFGKVDGVSSSQDGAQLTRETMLAMAPARLRNVMLHAKRAKR